MSCQQESIHQDTPLSARAAGITTTGPSNHPEEQEPPSSVKTLDEYWRHAGAVKPMMMAEASVISGSAGTRRHFRVFEGQAFARHRPCCTHPHDRVLPLSLVPGQWSSSRLQTGLYHHRVIISSLVRPVPDRATDDDATGWAAA